jgi:hypothetical protein
MSGDDVPIPRSNVIVWPGTRAAPGMKATRNQTALPASYLLNVRYEANCMQRSFPRSIARITSGLLFVSLAGIASLAHAQNTAQAATAAQATPPVDPTFSAYSLTQSCQQKSDNVAQGQCVGAVRGIIHGYQYGVLFLSQRTSLAANETQRVSLCLRDVPVSTIVDEFVQDASQVSPDALKRTPAEVAVLGSVHMHHACE